MDAQKRPGRNGGMFCVLPDRGRGYHRAAYPATLDPRDPLDGRLLDR